MLNVWYKGGNVTVLTNAPLYFDGVFEPEWFDDPLVKEMVKDGTFQKISEKWFDGENVCILSAD